MILALHKKCNGYFSQQRIMPSVYVWINTLQKCEKIIELLYRNGNKWPDHLSWTIYVLSINYDMFMRVCKYCISNWIESILGMTVWLFLSLWYSLPCHGWSISRRFRSREDKTVPVCVIKQVSKHDKSGVTFFRYNLKTWLLILPYLSRCSETSCGCY